jgi:lipopolysaccharide/colanic/teichoic acid biosynthesis glycosyltransferase
MLNFTRRIFDVSAASLLLLGVTPILLVAVVAIMALSPGSPFFLQARIGRMGRRFTMYKLRTMHLDAAARLEARLADSPADRAEWVAYGRFRDDPRVIPIVGRALRRFSIDEMPQFLNVITGDMSLVGPRPLEPHVAETVDGAAMAERCCVAPGLTGLWQISGRSDLSIAEMISLDQRYLRTRSWKTDIGILVRTPSQVVSGRGAY